MDIGSVINILLLLVTTITVLIAAVQFLNQKASNEQVRFVSVYPIKLFDTRDNAWAPLKIAPAHEIKEIESMACALIVENNSGQPVRNFYATINPEAFQSIGNDGKEIPLQTVDGADQAIPVKIASSVGPFKIIPPGIWAFSIDITPLDDGQDGSFQGMNSLKSVLAFGKTDGDIDYNPVARTIVEPLGYYKLQDNMGAWWLFEGETLRLRKRKKEPFVEKGTHD